MIVAVVLTLHSTNKSMRGGGGNERFRLIRERTPQEKITLPENAVRSRNPYEVYMQLKLYNAFLVCLHVFNFEIY